MNQPNKENLMNKRIIELKEMLEREDKLLANKKFIDKLKDKGEKIRIKRNEIERIIKIKESVEETESFLAKLSLGDKQILPKHPMFSASKDDIKLAKQSINNQKDGKEVLKEIINGELDIFSVAITRTYDNELSQKKSERFVLNRINKNLNRKNNETKLTNKSIDLNKQNIKDDNKILSNQESHSSNLNQESQSSNQDKVSQSSNLNQDKISQSSNTKEQSNKSQSTVNKKELIFTKYKNTALEPLEDKSKIIPLSIESSLEFGKEQKVKDYEVEKLRLEKRLTWRKIIEFDSDESESSSEESEIDYLNDD